MIDCDGILEKKVKTAIFTVKSELSMVGGDHNLPSRSGILKRFDQFHLHVDYSVKFNSLDLQCFHLAN